MRRRQPLRRAPLWIAGMCPQLTNQALAAEAHLETKRTGMRMCVGTRTWRAAAIHQDQRAACNQARETGLRRLH
jgi:hypothetical protein